MKMGQLLYYCYINGGIDGYLRQHTYVRMNISMYGKMHGHAESKSAALVLRRLVALTILKRKYRYVPQYNYLAT